MNSTERALVSLATLKPGTRAVICSYKDTDLANALSNRMMEMGLTIGAEIEVAYEAPFGGAIAVRCRGSLIALRLLDAQIMQVNAL